MTWNPWKALSAVKEELVALNQKYDALRAAKESVAAWADTLSKSNEKLIDKTAEFECRAIEAEKKIDDAIAALSSYVPSTATLKSNKSLRMELEAATAAVRVAKDILYPEENILPVENK